MGDTTPHNWESARLGKYIELQGGYAFKSELFTESGIPIIRISNIRKDGSISLREAARIENDETLERFEITNGDVLIAMSGATTGKVGVYRNTEKPI